MQPDIQDSDIQSISDGVSDFKNKDVKIDLNISND